MIDNVVMLITGALKQKDVAELLPHCHPLGAFDQMAALGIARTPAELHATILVDTPLGRVLPRDIFFQLVRKKKKSQKLTRHCCCVEGQFFQDALSESSLDAMEVEILRNKLHKVATGSLPVLTSVVSQSRPSRLLV